MLNNSRAFVSVLLFTPKSSNVRLRKYAHAPSSVDWKRLSSTSYLSKRVDSDHEKVQLKPQTQNLVKQLKRQTENKYCVTKNKKCADFRQENKIINKQLEALQNVVYDEWEQKEMAWVTQDKIKSRVKLICSGNKKSHKKRDTQEDEDERPKL